jgi:two-component system phosphate regulon response regulator PhoB
MMEGCRQQGARPCILVAEDEAALRAMLRYNLEQQGYRVEEAEEGPDALTKIVEAVPDLVILDWMLPTRSGIEVCRVVRAARRSRTCRF